MMASAPATSASGAAAPICADSADGMRKIPPPTITLITAAVSANEPTARTSAASPIRLDADGDVEGERTASFIGKGQERNRRSVARHALGAPAGSGHDDLSVCWANARTRASAA